MNYVGVVLWSSSAKIHITPPKKFAFLLKVQCLNAKYEYNKCIFQNAKL